MNNIDYNDYSINCTLQFCDGLAQLKRENKNKEVDKLFKIIDEIINDVDMYQQEYSRQLKGSKKIEHIHLDGRRTGDIILLYTVTGKSIDLDLKLYNITDHKNLSKVSAPKYTNRQKFDKFNVIENKFSATQIEYVEECYLNLISDYNFNTISQSSREQYAEDYIKNYLEDFECSPSLSYDEFLQILHYIEDKNHRNIFGALEFNPPQHTSPITEREELYILNLIQSYDVEIDDAYIETEIDEYGDTYESMYVQVNASDRREIKLLESELYTLDKLFGITFEIYLNDLGIWSRTFKFSHYFEG